MCTGDQTHHVFISHRMEDREIALAIKRGLEDVAGKEKICVHVCTKNQGVQDWRKEITDSIRNSRTMVFLYTVDQEEEWRWCMYEIGLFNGLKLDGKKDRKLICIKNFYLKELPSPIGEAPEPYVADPEGTGIEKFFLNLLKDTNEKLVEDLPEYLEEKKERALVKIKKKFERSRLEKEYYSRRITVKFTDEKNKVKEKVGEAVVTCEDSTMQTLFGKENNVRWDELYRKLKKTGQNKWLDQLRENIDAIQYKNTFEKDLSPINIDRYGTVMSYIPIMSSVTKNRIPEKEDEKGRIKRYEVTELNVIFIKQTIGRDNILKAIPTLIPFCKIRMYLEGEEGSFKKQLQKDESGNDRQPVVEEMNKLSMELYDIRENESNCAKKRWTTSVLINRLRDFNLVDPENLEKLGKDQKRVIEELVLHSKTHVEAHVPIAFNENHNSPEYRNQCFLPCLTNIQTEGDPTGKHEAILLVAYVKHFWPPDHENKPTNRARITA